MSTQSSSPVPRHPPQHRRHHARQRARHADRLPDRLCRVGRERILDPHVDLLLVGDSLGMVLYGLPSTLGRHDGDDDRARPAR